MTEFEKLVLEKLENAGNYWKLGRPEKLGFAIGNKLGII